MEELKALVSEEKETWVVSRAANVPKDSKPETKRSNPADIRENALAKIADRLGESKNWNQRANNAFVYYMLPTFTSFGMAFEKRMNQLIGLTSASIVECTCKLKEGKPCKDHSGRSILIEGGIFENTNTLTEWFMNFFQQSTSINGLARENQVDIAKAGYTTATVPTWSPFGKEEKAAEVD